MRILMLDNELPPKGGGMGTAHLALLRYFTEQPYLQIDTITSALDNRPGFEQFTEGIRIYRVPVGHQDIHHASNRELSAYALQALRTAARLQREHPYDFCFAWSTLPAGAVALALKRFYRLPYMVWVSGPDIPGFEKRYHVIYRLFKPLILSIWRGAQPLIAKCQEEVEMIQRSDPTVAVTVIANGVDLENFQPGAPIPDDGELQVVCSARLIERKGQCHLIQALQLLKKDGILVHAHLLGDGDALPAYEQLAKELQVDELVHFHGFVAPKEMACQYQAGHVFVLPSYNEGMSLAALEAMACGLPLVVTRTGGTSELVEDGVNGLTFGWGETAELARHLKHLSQDRALARRMGSFSMEKARRFAWEGIAQQYVNLFARSLDKTV